MRKFLWISVILLVALLSASLAACGAVPGPTVREEFDQTYQVAADTEIDVENVNGDVNIDTWNNDNVQVHATKSTQFGQAELDKVEIQVSTVGGLSIQTVPVGRNVRVSVTYDIKIPATAVLNGVHTSNGSVDVNGGRGDLSADSSNGDINIQNVDGFVSASTTNGSISVKNTTGLVLAKSSNGKIDVDIQDIQGNVQVTTSNGAIQAYLAKTLNAEIDASTSNGSVSAHDVPLTNIESSRTSLSGRLGNGGPTVTLHTSNGSIDLNLLQ